MSASVFVPGSLAYYDMLYAMPQDDQVYKEVKNPPVYPGGNEAMQKFIIENIKYPADCKKSGKEGTVYVGFIIDKSGKVKDVKARKPVHPSLDAEAERIVKAMPAWQPGSNAEGKNVKVEYTLPIKFALK
jgi:protein TonB